jgi:putative transposase
MGDTWHKLYYHITWGTKYRQPTITPEIERHLHRCMVLKAKDLGCQVHACNGVEDHVHMALAIPPRLRVSNVVGQIKGYSAHEVNKLLRSKRDPPQGWGLSPTLEKRRRKFRWQRGFGVVSFAQKDLPRIVRYIKNQKAHHRRGSTDERLERTD